MASLDCKRAVEVEIPAEEVEREAGRIARDIQRRARVPGFRPGKAPLSLVRQRYEANIREKVLESMVPAYLRTAFERDNVEPVSRPAIEDLHFHSGEPIRFKASFEVLPTFDLGDYRTLQLPPPPAPERTVEEELTLTLAHLREQAATYEDAPEGTKATKGITVQAAYDRQAEGESDNHHIANTMIDLGGEGTLAEFNEALEGAATGETREFDVQYPANFDHPAVAGKKVHFKLTVNALKHKHLPDLDDTFASQHQAESLEALKQRVRAQIEARRKETAREHSEHEVAERLLAMHDFPVPEALIEEQARSRMEREARSLADQGIDPAKLNVDWSGWRTRQEERAAQDVKLALILDRIAAAEHIEASDEEVRKELTGLAERLQQPAEAFLRRMKESGFQERTKTRMRNDKTMEFLLRQAAAAATTESSENPSS